MNWVILMGIMISFNEFDSVDEMPSDKLSLDVLTAICYMLYHINYRFVFH